MPFEKPTAEQLQNRFMHHPPKGNQAEGYEIVRSSCLELAHIIVAITPCSPEQSRALNSLDEVMFLANAAIARNE